MPDDINVKVVVDEAANDSDKTLDPAFVLEKPFTVESIHVDLSTTATIGNRQLEVQFQDAAGTVLGSVVAGALQVASLSNFLYLFAHGVPDLAVVRDTNKLYNAIPRMRMPQGGKVRVFDNNAVDATADDMLVRMVVTY